MVCLRSLLKGPVTPSWLKRQSYSNIDLFCFFFSVCPAGVTLTETSSVITSPFFPRKYPDNQNCSWQITAPQGKYVKLELDIRLNIQQCGTGFACTCDYLRIQNGFSDDPSANERICGAPGRKTFYSTHQNLEVLFVSDGTNSKQFEGFKATYTQLSHTPPSK